MKVKISRATVERLIGLLETFDANTEQFLDELPTPEKYAVLAMAWVIQSNKDLETAYDDATHLVSAQELTKYLLAFRGLNEHLRDALGLGWEYFEFPVSNDDESEEA
jgi:hypothetical protein